ncbi:DNA-directed RNA polymerase III subunit RPC8 [Lates japonicus]|uniref:DNA-directed RNA polymerase subunit n=1 Tax=Lates japonicus TaxID=270547 RepID=A0AAD3NF22_LATJO|nr:DNA-directed RNA polymerase III subunit RPC8 [Lates japonicus]
MFVLVEMVDTVRIPPWNFHRQLNEAIAEELNKKLANKVVYNVGLCICLYDITKLEDSYIFPGDGASHTKVHFRYVVFHPFLDEILVGKIKYCSQEGVHVTMGFFDDILIPAESLQQPAKFDEAEQVWLWEYETDEGAHDLYMDQGEEIRFRVTDEVFVDKCANGPTTQHETRPAQLGQSTAPPAGQRAEERGAVHSDWDHLASDAQVLLEDRLEATALTWIPAEPVSHTEAGFSEQTDSQIHQPTDSGVNSPSAACGSRSSSSIQHCIHTILPHPPSPPLCHI